jgi:ribose/xylose/arabinose/galactoside ABC-type transport system permease subunit
MNEKSNTIGGRERAKRSVKAIYVYVILLLVVAALSLIKGDLFQRGNFLYADNIMRILMMSVPVIIVSACFTFIMISGNIDLSVGSMLSLTTVFFAILVRGGMGFWPALLLTLALGVVSGGINGWLVMQMRITPVIATLITMSVYQGIARYLVPEGISSIQSTDTLKMPEWINDFTRGDAFPSIPQLHGLSWAMIVAVLVIVLLVVLQRRTVLGKYVAAIGGNRTAAELSGVNVVKTIWGVYMLMGVLTALAGVANASYSSVGEPNTGKGLETQAIIAVLLGGTAFTGGEGSVVKSVIGALVIVCLTQGLKGVIPDYWQSLAIGIVLVLAVALNHVVSQESVTA